MFWLKLSMLGVCLRLNCDLCIQLFLKFHLKLFCWEKYIVLLILNSEEPSFEKLYQFHSLKQGLELWNRSGFLCERRCHENPAKYEQISSILPKNGQKSLCPYKDTYLEAGMKFRSFKPSISSANIAKTHGDIPTRPHGSPDEDLVHQWLYSLDPA